MEYFWAIGLCLIILPLLVLLASRRKSGAAGIESHRDHGITVTEPSSDQPTPRSDAVNQIAPGTELRLPPG